MDSSNLDSETAYFLIEALSKKNILVQQRLVTKLQDSAVISMDIKVP